MVLMKLPWLGQFFFESFNVTHFTYLKLMEINRTQNVVLGIFTILPFIIFPIIFLQVFGFVINIVATSEHSDPEPADILLGISSFLVPIILVSLLSLALLIFYIVHAATNKKLESIEQLMWILLFVFFGIIAFPIYWILRIWNTSKNP